MNVLQAETSVIPASRSIYNLLRDMKHQASREYKT